MTKKLASAVATAILSAADTGKLIVSIKGRGAKLDKDIHQAGLSALANHAQHGNTSLVNALLVAMPKSARANALMAWMLAMDPKLAKNPAKDATAPLVHAKDQQGEFDASKADATPFWEFKVVEGGKPFSFDAYMASLTKGIERAMAEATVTEEQKAILAKAKAALGATAQPAH
ncbi:hypothetical protein VAC51_00012 [Variovorax phage VAC_51]|uniref:Uncharacterized protein n=1 Tax=Variovorax phage VAC_51 TaxID=2985242 RepID=A0A9N6WSB5_9CAUD|nr:hypothetical protein VAC51_00012 [Variovorax phage VAC_51]